MPIPPCRQNTGKAAWTSVVTNKCVNELRFGWFKDRLSDPGAADLYPETGAISITVAGATIGGPQAYPRTYPSEETLSARRKL